MSRSFSSREHTPQWPKLGSEALMGLSNVAAVEEAAAERASHSGGLMGGGSTSSSSRGTTDTLRGLASV